LASFDRLAAATLVAADTAAIPHDRNGVSAVEIRVISASNLAHEAAVGRAAATMLGRHQA
jgi:hypothetical protein